MKESRVWVLEALIWIPPSWWTGSRKTENP